MQKLGNYVLIQNSLKFFNRDAGLMGDSAYRFYSPKALQNWSQMFWEHPGRWCSIYRTPTLPLAANRTAGLRACSGHDPGPYSPGIQGFRYYQRVCNMYCAHRSAEHFHAKIRVGDRFRKRRMCSSYIRPFL